MIERISCLAFADQNPGTSGLRKKTAAFRRPHYLATYIQAIIDAQSLAGASLALGGDGRFFAREAAEIVLRVAAGNGVARVLVGQGALLSTPAMSAVIRARGLAGGIILSASHNPGGPEGDFGVKFNLAHGGPATDAANTVIFAAARASTGYSLYTGGTIDLDRPGRQELGPLAIHVIDPLADHLALLESMFDLERLRAQAGNGFRFVFDAMHAVSGPYAKALFVERLGFPAESVRNAEPLPDFGGEAPDPNPVHAGSLVRIMSGPAAPDLGAASDGDGDRHMILGPDCPVGPSDSLAVLVANAHLVPAYREGLRGAARSMPTSRAVDRVCRDLELPCHETPTGWKYFSSLLDAGRATICGEESYGAGGDHLREKDGLWAVLFWLDILAATGKSVPALLAGHWRRFGRHYYSRHDYDGLDPAIADEIYEGLRAGLGSLAGARRGGQRIERAEDFAYADPVDGSVSADQGLVLALGEESRIILRRSGTGTAGATLRLYLERYEPAEGKLDLPPQRALAGLVELAEEIVGIRRLTGRARPDVVT